MLGDAEKFNILFAKNKARVEAGWNYNGAFDGLVGKVIAEVVRDTIKEGTFSFGYQAEDKQPMMRFIDQDSYCEKRAPLRAFLKEMVEHYGSEINPNVDGDPVDYRFARFMLAAVDFFVKEERAGRNPQ